MRIITATHIFINDAFTEDVYLVFDDNRTITDVFIQPDVPIESAERYDGLLVPGWVNAHCHLELSHLKGLIPRHIPMAEFARYIIQNRYQKPENQEPAIRTAIKELHQTGTVLVGDISNEEVLLQIKKEVHPTITIHTFWELFGFDEEKALQAFQHGAELANQQKHLFSLTPHAPYSVLPQLMEKIVDWNIEHNTRLSIHALESKDEMDYFTDFSGNFRDFFSQIGYEQRNEYHHPLDYLLANFRKELKVMYVHAVEAQKEDIEKIKTITPDYFICLCPRSNEYIHNKLPDLHIFEPQRLCLGTDSLASNMDLDVLKEILCLHQAFPDFPLVTLLNMATKQGAQALSFEAVFGQFKQGFRPGAVLIQGFDSKSAKLHQESTGQRLL